MRITAGKFKKTRLCGIKGLQIRPTSDKLREAYFDIIGDLVIGAGFLDLFAGTGAVGIEALSRGAASADFVDNNPGCISAIRANCGKCRVEHGVSIHGGEVLAFLDRAAGARGFDLIYADPPYDYADYDRLLARLGESGTPAPGALTAVEHRRGADPNPPPGWTITDRRRYGDSCLTFLRRTRDHEDRGGLEP